MGKKRPKRSNGEGTEPYKRKDGRWACRPTIHTPSGPRRKWVYGKTRKEANDKQMRLLVETAGRIHFEPENITLGEYLSRWLTDSVSGSVSELTRFRYAQDVRLHIAPVLGHTKLQKLTPAHLQGFYSMKLSEGLSGSTVRGFHKVLRKALGEAERWGIVAQNAATLTSPPQPSPQEFTVLTEEQAQRFLEAARGNPYEALFVLALSTGMRQGELLGLKWPDVDLAGGTVAVRRAVVVIGSDVLWSEGKTKSSRVVKIGERTLSHLKSHRASLLEHRMASSAREWQEQDLVFPGHNGGVYRRQSLESRFRKLKEVAGVPDIRFHDLRHTAITLMLQRLPVHVVSRRVGHKDPAMTLRRYAHVLPDQFDKAADEVETMLF